MSIAEHRQAAAQGRPRTGWALGCLLAGSIAAAAAAAGAGCGQRNLAVITLEGQPSSATALTAYYRLDGGDWKTVEPVHSLQQFGLELPKERSAALETQIFSYTNNMPCILGSAAGSTDLDGSSIRELQLPVTTTTSRCYTTAEPADFPQGKMVVWAYAANDIWLAGTGGKVVHWDGAAYTKVPLPADLMKTPPDWNAILGSSAGVWIAGTNGALVRYAQGALSSVPPLSMGATDWRSMSLADGATLMLVGTNRLIGVATPLGVAQVALNSATGELTAVACSGTGDPVRCFVVTDTGNIASATLDLSNASLQQRNIPSPTTKGLLDIFVGVNLTTQLYDVRTVGKSGVALRATLPLVAATTTDPNFKAANTDYSSFVPQSARVDLNRINGASTDELWVAGQGGVLLRWNNTPAGMAPVMPFTQSQSGTTADLFSISEFATNLFFSGANHTLGYLGPMFTPH